MSKRLIACILAILLTASLLSLFGCGQDFNPSIEPDTETEEEETEPESSSEGEEETLYPFVPDQIRNTNETVVIEVAGWANFAPLDVPDIGVTEMEADTLSMEAFERDKWISEYLGITMEVRSRPNIDESVNTVRNLVQTGASDVDLWLMRSSAYGQSITGNLLSPLDRRGLSMFNADADWWDPASYSALSVAGLHYGVIGDFTVADDMTYWNVYFNKDMVTSNELTSPYTLVTEGRWTFEKMYELASQVVVDTDQPALAYDDIHGISMIRDVLAGSMNVAGVRIASKDSEDLPVISFYNEDTVDFFEGLCDIFYDQKVVYNCHTQGGDEIGIFTNGTTLFTLGGIYYAPLMRSTELSFGLLPMPKYDSWEPYRAATSPLFLSILTTPRNEKGNDAVVSAFMELYAAEGSRSVVPAFHDKLLKLKVARDEESAEMLDYIFSNTVYDIGAIYNFANFSFTLVDMMYTQNRNLTSVWAANEQKVQADIDKMLDALNSQ